MAASPKITRTLTEWRRQLTFEQFRVTRMRHTEAPFSGAYWDCHARGTYCCVCCGTRLFSSETKFDSGTGWPSFHTPLDPEHIGETEDLSQLMRRIEVHCRTCAAHLGHVFPDGPAPTGLRYCINSAALKLIRDEDQ